MHTDRQHDPDDRTRILGPSPDRPARRVVSLVPSLTLAVHRLGALGSLVGRTRYCTRPEELVGRIVAVGGPRDPDLAAVRRLRPDLVLASREECSREPILDLASDTTICLADPREPIDALGLWRTLGDLLGRRAGAEEAARSLAQAIETARREPGPGPRFLYYVWKQPWMVAGQGTWISGILETAGLRNAAPPGRTYPVLTAGEMSSAKADLHIFGSEPCSFELPRDIEPLGPCSVVPSIRSLLACGSGASGSGPPDTCPGGRPPVPPGTHIFALESGGLAIPADGEALGWYPSLAEAGLHHALEIRRAWAQAAALRPGRRSV